MATLLEMLATDWDRWPTSAGDMQQDEDGNIWTQAGKDKRAITGCPEVASDQATARVSRADWERARTAYLDSIAEGQSTASDCKPQEPQTQAASGQDAISYEQRLWDEVALAALQPLLQAEADDMPETGVHQVIANGAARIADAFMAERAKRMGSK